MKKCNDCKFLKINTYTTQDDGVWVTEDCELHKFKLFCNVNKKKTKEDKCGDSSK